MNTVVANKENVFADYDHMKSYTFMNTALMAGFVNIPNICSNLELLEDIYARLSRIECLLPTYSSA